MARKISIDLILYTTITYSRTVLWRTGDAIKRKNCHVKLEETENSIENSSVGGL